MENLELQTQVINLGKLFVKELGLEPGVDTFSRWMAHYIAEKITKAENSSGEKKEIAEKECFDAILKLWTHRWSLPSRRRPLEDFAPLLNLLQKINPDRDERYFYPEIPVDDRTELDTLDNETTSNLNWIVVAEEIDKTARIWLEFALQQAATNAKSDAINDWLNNAASLLNSEDTEIIRMLIFDDSSVSLENYNQDELQKKQKAAKIKRRIEQLEKFGILNGILLKGYQAELKDSKH